MRWVERAGWVALGLACVSATFAITVRPVGFDLSVYMEAARAVANGRSPYVPASSGACAEAGCFLYPPVVALVFLPLLALPREIAVWGFVALSAGLAAAVATFLIAPLPRPARPWAAAMAAGFFPLLLDLNLGNVNLLTAALALAAWSARERPARGGALLAAAVGIKLLAAPILLFYAAAGQGRTLAWAAAWTLFVELVTAKRVGRYWGAELGAIADQTLRTGGGIRSGPLEGTVGQIATIVLAAIVMVAAGAAARRPQGRGADLHALALATCPLAASAIYYTFLVLGLPLLAAIARSLASRPVLLVLPGTAWLAMEAQEPLWRSAGLLGAIALGLALFVVRPASMDRSGSRSIGA